jgi:uncharacterized membrane protein YciS (DUF1049 family)
VGDGGVMDSVLLYFIVFAFVFAIQTYAMKQTNQTAKRTLAIMSFLPILLLIGLRYRVGTDWIGHVKIYELYSSMPFEDVLARGDDIGSKLIIGLAPHIFNDYKPIFWIYGLLTLYPIYKINKNHGFKYLAYSTLVFNLTIFPASLNIMRQCAAAAFALLAFDYLKTQQKFKIATIVCIIIATILHTSALIMLPFLILYRVTRKRRKTYWWLSILLGTAIAFSLTTVLKDIFAAIGYTEYDYIMTATSNISFSLSAILLNTAQYIMMLFVFLLYQNSQGKNDSSIIDTKNIFSLVLNGSIFELVGTATKYLSRISFYFSFYQIILMPTMLQNIKNKKNRLIAKTICISTFAIVFVVHCFILRHYEIIPYKTWLIIG